MQYFVCGIRRGGLRINGEGEGYVEERHKR